MALGTLTLSLGFDAILLYFRLDGADLQTITSTRWGGIISMWKMWIASPFIGIGFGAADRTMEIWPSNMLYFALPVEIGIIGYIGALSFMYLPIIYRLKYMIKIKSLTILREKCYLSAFSVVLVSAFFPYLFFEFNILRVSAENQLFFFCWSIVMFDYLAPH